MRTLLRRLSAGAFAILVATLIAAYAVEDQTLKGGATVVIWGCLIASAVFYVLLSDFVFERFQKGPLLAAGAVFTEERLTQDGRSLQVLIVPIYNRQDSSGAKSTAGSVVPKLEAIGPDGHVFEDTTGVWVKDWQGKQPDAVTFRATHERHGLELVAKFESDESAFLAGQVDANLPPGRIRIRASLRGDNVRKPAAFEWLVTNPGAGDWLGIEAIETAFLRRRPRGVLSAPTNRPQKPLAEAVSPKDGAAETESPPVAREMTSPEVQTAKFAEHGAMTRAEAAAQAGSESGEDDELEKPPKRQTSNIVMADRAELRLRVEADPFHAPRSAQCEVTAPSGTTYRPEVQLRAPAPHPLLGAISSLFGPREAVVDFPTEFPNTPLKLEKGVYRVHLGCQGRRLAPA